MPRTAQNSEEDLPQTPAPATPLTQDVLLTLIATMQQQVIEAQKSQAEANAKLAEAIGKLNEPKAPYVDPAKAINEEQFRKQMDQIHAFEKANKAYAESNCSHIAGSNQLSDTPDLYGRTAIAWHTGDIGQEFGICTVCGHVFRDIDSDFHTWRQKKSINHQSASGHRTVFDPIGARKKIWGE